MLNIRDLRTLTFILGFFSIEIFLILKVHISFFLWIPLLALCSFGVFIVSVINHNHRHCEILKKMYANRIVNLLISMAIGAPSARLHHVHLLNHHRMYNKDDGKEDWASYTLVKDLGPGLERLFRYVVLATKKMAQNRNLLVLTKNEKRELFIERTFVYLFLGFGLFVNFKMTLFVIIPASFLGLMFLLLANFFNHDRCNLSSDSSHSRNFLGNFENWIFFNNGFHYAHHLKPGLHWSELPELHFNELKKGVETVDEYSMFQYAWKEVKHLNK